MCRNHMETQIALSRTGMEVDEKSIPRRLYLKPAYFGKEWRIYGNGSSGSVFHGVEKDSGNRRELFGSRGKSWPCTVCALHFPSHRSMAVHRATVHGMMHVAHCYITGSHCPACKMDHHTRRRAVQHLKRTGHCLTALRYHYPDPFLAGFFHGKEVAEGAELLDRKKRPPVKLPGEVLSLSPCVYRPLPPAPQGYSTPEELEAVAADPDQQVLAFCPRSNFLFKYLAFST